MDSPTSNKRKKTLDLTSSDDSSSSSLPRFLPQSLTYGVRALPSLESIVTPVTTTTTTTICATTSKGSSTEAALVPRVPYVNPRYVPRDYQLPVDYKIGYWSSPPPPLSIWSTLPSTAEEPVSPLLDLLDMHLDPYLCQWICERLTLIDLWGLAQVTRQRMVTFRIAMLGGVGTHIPSALQSLYMHKLGTVSKCVFDLVCDSLFMLSFCALDVCM